MKFIYDRPAAGTKKFPIFLDEYMYASLLANKERAEFCVSKNSVDYSWGKDGWIALTLHYVDCINMLLDEFPNAITYIDSIEYNRLLILRSKTHLTINSFVPYYSTPIQGVDICKYAIEAIKIMQTIFDMELKLDYLRAEYLKLRNLESTKLYYKYKSYDNGNNK